MKNTRLSTTQCILVYNAFSSTGHHDSWTTLVISSLIKKGYKVVCITKNAEQIHKILGNSRDITDNVQIFELKKMSPNSQKRHWKLKMKKAWRTFLGIPVYNVCDREQFEEQSSKDDNKTCNKHKKNTEVLLANGKKNHATKDENWLRYLHRLRKGISFFLTPSLRAKIRIKISQFIIDELDPTSTVGIKTQISAIIPMINWPIDFLFFMYIDMLPHFNWHWRGKNGLFFFPWGGICFAYDPATALARRQSAYFKKSQFKGLCIPNSMACNDISLIATNKIFTCIPDITNTDIMDTMSVLSKQLRDKSAGRKIVLLCGSIESRKNIRSFCQMARLADAEKWYFAIVGEIYSISLTPEDVDSILTLLNCCRNNFFVHNDFLEDERELNNVINESNILFCAYRNFTKSSNMISKAAYFDKPIIVSKGYEMGAMVEHYRIGRCVHEDDVPAMVETLEDLDRHPVDPACFATYRREHNKQAFASSIQRFISLGLAG